MLHTMTIVVWRHTSSSTRKKFIHHVMSSFCQYFIHVIVLLSVSSSSFFVVVLAASLLHRGYFLPLPPPCVGTTTIWIETHLYIVRYSSIVAVAASCWLTRMWWWSFWPPIHLLTDVLCGSSHSLHHICDRGGGIINLRTCPPAAASLGLLGLGGTGGATCTSAHCLVQLLLGRPEGVLEERIVNEGGSLCWRKHHPHQEGQFEAEVERNPVQDDVDKVFHDSKYGIYHPVDEPLSVIITGTGLNGQERAVCWVDKTHQVADKTCTKTKKKGLEVE